MKQDFSSLQSSIRTSSAAMAWCAGVILAMAAAVNSAFACVGCRVTSEEMARIEPSTVTAGVAFSWSVLFMLFVVGGILTFLVTYISRVVAQLDQRNNLPPQ
jgi:Mg2+/Co2+ transporter CorB